MKKYIYNGLWVCALCLIPVITQAQDNVVDEVVWVVGDEAILKSDVENMRLQMQYEGEQMSGDPYCVIPEQIAIKKLFLHQAKLDSIAVSDAHAIQAADQWINYVMGRIGSKEKMEEYFINKPLEKIREERIEFEKEQATIEQVQEKLVGEVKMTPSEVRKYYAQLPKDSLPFIPTTVEVQIITLEPKIPIEEIDQIKARLRDFSEKVNSGEAKFSTLARLYSEDSSAPQGGELGFKGKGTFVPEFAAVAFSLTDPNKVSKVVETEYGYHIIQLIEKRGDRVNCRHILLKPKVSEKELNATIHKLDSIDNDIKSGKFTFEEAATYLSYDKDTRNNKGLMVNSDRSSVYNRTSKFEMQELPVEVGRVVETMKPGEISAPFVMLNSKQKEVVAIVKLKSRVEQHKANLSDDYQILKSVVESRKKQEIIDQWIAKKQKDTYIRINDNWKNCDFQYSGWIKE